MKSRKIQRSGTTHYLYLPASWCREHNITTDSVVYLEKSSKGNLIIHPKKTEKNLTSLELELDNTDPEVINKMIIASYINPVKKFRINLKNTLSPDQVLEHKNLLGGLELVDFEDSSITCQTSIPLSDPKSVIMTMIKKVLNIVALMKDDSTHGLIERYEQEVDKSNLLISKSIVSGLMFRRESDLRHIELFYLGMISRSIEQITDILISIEEDDKLIDDIEKMMKDLLDVFSDITKEKVTRFVKKLAKIEAIEVEDLKTYKRKRVYSTLGHISEHLCDWIITDIVDEE